MNLQHFEELRARINAQLEKSRAPHRSAQINDFHWLYGALGQVPSEVMFICENPSLTGVTRANVDTVDGGPPDIEAQWWGGRKNPAAKRFRVALHRLGLKESPPAEKGGWRCYITNVIKEMNIAGDNGQLSASERRRMAHSWASVLSWEIETVRPKHVFCVGGKAHEHVRWLVENRLVPDIRPKVVTHYSARLSDQDIIEGIVDPVARAVGLSTPTRASSVREL